SAWPTGWAAWPRSSICRSEGREELSLRRPPPNPPPQAGEGSKRFDALLSPAGGARSDASPCSLPQAGARSDASSCSLPAGGGIETIRRLAPSRRRQDSKRYVILPLPACGGLEAIRRLAPSPACGGGLGWGQGRSDAAGVASFRHGSVKRPSTPLRYPPAMRLPH